MIVIASTLAFEQKWIIKNNSLQFSKIFWLNFILLFHLFAFLSHALRDRKTFKQDVFMKRFFGG